MIEKRKNNQHVVNLGEISLELIKFYSKQVQKKVNLKNQYNGGFHLLESLS